MQHHIEYNFGIDHTDRLISEALRLYGDVAAGQREIRRIHVNFTHGIKTVDVTLKTGEKVEIDVPTSPKNQAKLAMILYSYSQLFLPLQNYGVFSAAAGIEITTKHAATRAVSEQKSLDKRIDLYLKGFSVAKSKDSESASKLESLVEDETSLIGELRELREKYDSALGQVEVQKKEIGSLNREKHLLNRKVEYIRSTLANALNKLNDK